jgi:Tfp pilus assembly protein PilX
VPRRGAVLVVIIVCFVVAATLFVLLATSAVAERRAAETRQWSLQAQWLAEAALERAAARLDKDAKYEGETWTVPAAQLGGNHGGVVNIGLDSSDTDHPQRRLVRVEAYYPDDPVHRCRWEKQVVMERRRQP